MQENMVVISRHLVRVILRMVPIIPGPELFDLIDDLKKNKSNIDQKIQRAFASMQETSSLLSEIEKSLKERSEKLSSLRSEVDRYSKLAEVEGEKANALIQQMELSLNKGKIAERWVSFAINIIAGVIIFGLGIFLGPKITNWFGVK